MPMHVRTRTTILTLGILFVISLWLTGESHAATTVTQQGSQWRTENERVSVTLDPQTGNLAVTDKASGRKWLPPDAAPAAPPRTPIPTTKAAKPITVDGDLADWPAITPLVLTADMLAHAKDVKDNRDLSAVVYCLWDERNLYLALKVVDDACKFAAPGSGSWWEADSVEFWVGGVQVGLALWPQKSAAFRGANQALDGATVVVKPAPQIGSLKDMELVPKQHGLDVVGRPGYVVEAAIPLPSFADLREAKPGRTFPFAIGLNDADATGSREGQLYLPKTWIHSQPETFAPAVLADEKGVALALPTQAQKAARARNVVALANQGVSFETDIPVPGGKTAALHVKLTVPDGASQFTLEYDMADRKTQIGNFAFPEPLAADSPNCAVAVADYCDGHLYPLNDPPYGGFKGRGWDGARLDMPWVGVVDVQKGHGYLLHLETSDDSRVSLKQVTAGGIALLAPQITWTPSKSQLRYARRATYHFSPSGGYVALAKIYRGIAKAQGLVVPFTEKRKKNPNLDKLMGSWDVWGADGLRFAQAIRAAGVTRSLIHGRWSADDMRAINDMGFLTSEYDNYTDILPPKEPGKIDSNHAPIPEHVVKKSDGSEMTAWLTWDKKRQYMKRCPALWVDAAKIVMPAVLEKHPYLGRFIDVTTAEGLYECYDPIHPLVKTEKRQCGVDLLSYTRSLGLVVGGEHGIWWGVPVQDYIEGMMSGGNYSWPAGHLIRPKSKDEEFTSPWGHKHPKFEQYERYGVGHQFRVPLWELVFHDCVVSYWYWGDATDWLHDIAPEVTDKKDALNILYGTPPLIWAQYWQKHRERCLQTYRNVCKLHEQIGMDEMLSHEFVTEDRAVQRTRFSSGTVVTVNFGEKTYQVADGSRTLTLPQHGFHVKGPRITQWLALVDGSPATFIETPG
ncbi:MAG: hypothetical protein FJ279_01660, partial [Planctomycetes bacterium]|nr:hypothetical protein [Planctomycetota bacterium]